MKKLVINDLIKLVCIVVNMIIIISCVSTPESLENITYTEIQANNFHSFHTIAEDYDGVIITNAIIRISPIVPNILLVENSEARADDFILDNPDFIERIEENKKYNVYVRFLKEGGLFSGNGFTYTPLIERVDGLRTLEEINTEKAEKQQQEADLKAKKEAIYIEAQKKENTRLNQLGTALSDGYVYHGINEAKENTSLFDSGALESGHAYYISAYLVYAGGAMGGAVQSLISDPNYHYVNYISQKVKGEVVSASDSLLGTVPVSVIVIGGKAPSHIPIILGLIE